MKKMLNKHNAFSVVLCLMLVFCIGFYSSADPTTAWFSQTDGVSGQYTMEELYVNFNGAGIGENVARLDLAFKAATKLEDEDERNNMFEHAAEFYVFSAENTGTLPADVKIAILDANTQGDIMTSGLEDNGVRYFIYEFDISQPLSESMVQAVVFAPDDDPHKEYKEVYVNNETGRRVVKYQDSYYPTQLIDNLYSKITSTTDLSTTDSQVAFLNNAIDKSATLLNPGETKLYCVCFWIDYGSFVSITPDDGTDLRTLSCNVDIRINAVQHVEQTSASATENQ